MTTKEIAQQLTECCRSNVFCQYDFMIWYCRDNKQLFEFYLGELHRINHDYGEFYVVNNFNTLSFRVYLRQFLQDFFYAVKAEYSLTDILFHYERETESHPDV